jgi:hypothetical protein
VQCLVEWGRERVRVLEEAEEGTIYRVKEEDRKYKRW